jgi:hypothetical protein
VAASREEAVWIAYPHQNLGALARQVGDLERFVGGAARRLGLDPPLLPRCGPFTVPPASELAAGAAGGEPWVVARVYPALAATARLAGRLAGNPWLMGGEVEASGASVEVRWDGLAWQVGGPAPAGAPPSSEPLVALLRVDQGRRRVPPGLYGLSRTADGLALASLGTRPAPEWPAIAGDPALGVALLVLEREAAGERALVLFGEVLTGGLPRSAVLSRGGARRFDLPGEGLLGLLGELPSAQVAGWDVVGWDEESLRRAGRVAELLATLPPQVSSGVWVDPTRAHQVVRGVGEAIAKVPLLARGERRRWEDAEVVLEAMRQCRALSVTVVEQAPPTAALRLSGCG